MMKKLIAILLLGALLTLSFVGCNEQPNNGVTPSNADNTTTPEVTTPEVTTPNLDVTVPEETTPPLDIDPAPTAPEVLIPVPEEQLISELFGDEDIEFVAPIFFMNIFGSVWDPLPFAMKDGKIYLGGSPYSISLVENVTLGFGGDNYIDFVAWGIDGKNEKTVEAYQKIKSTTRFYRLEADSEQCFFYKEFNLCVIDGVYYFLGCSPNAHGRKLVIRVYRHTVLE